MFLPTPLRVKKIFIILFASIFITNTMQADPYIQSDPRPDTNHNKNHNNYSSIFKSTIQYANSVGGIVYVGTGVIGASSLLTFGVPLVLDPLITEASKEIDAQENPKTGLAVGVGNLVVAGLYGFMLQSAGLLSPFTVTLTGTLWAAKGAKCLVTGACQFVLAYNGFKANK